MIAPCGCSSETGVRRLPKAVAKESGLNSFSQAGEKSQQGESCVMEHTHNWMVFSTIAEGWLLARCECGVVGAIKDVSLEEWSQAYTSRSSPYAWTEAGRVEILVGWTTVLDKKRNVWTVVRE